MPKPKTKLTSESALCNCSEVTLKIHGRDVKTQDLTNCRFPGNKLQFLGRQPQYIQTVSTTGHAASKPKVKQNKELLQKNETEDTRESL